MDVKYFKDQIHEELEGARDYIERAIETKILHPTWSAKFCQMADMEAEHAATLMKMLETYIRSNANPKHTTNVVSGSSEGTMITPVTSSDEETYKDLMKVFGETMTYVTNMKRGL